ncbi:hypothetical protein GTW20_05085 [Nocardiopsis alba]|uniref:Uncharacterized protein n=1 Tax=Nocardiopsis alba TaxID=53437 RepID=A0A7K2INW8_9ACTN|nr:hypothetical protein [Nocardiopsis alba]
MAAAVAALLVWVVSTPLLGVELVVPGQGDAEPMEIGPGMIVGMSLASGLVGWGLLALLERFTSKGTLIWTIIAAIVLAGSMLSPLAMPGIDGAVRVILSLMHIVVGLIVIIGYRIPNSR